MLILEDIWDIRLVDFGLGLPTYTIVSIGKRDSVYLRYMCINCLPLWQCDLRQSRARGDLQSTHQTCQKYYTKVHFQVGTIKMSILNLSTSRCVFVAKLEILLLFEITSLELLNIVFLSKQTLALYNWICCSKRSVLYLSALTSVWNIKWSKMLKGTFCCIIIYIFVCEGTQKLHDVLTYVLAFPELMHN